MRTTINNNFEPVWESVRPVPIVTIDFGNGTKITRTLHGNIATYLCNARGTVFDILPGIYEPGEYLNQLNQFALLYRHTRQGFIAPNNLGDDAESRMNRACGRMRINGSKSTTSDKPRGFARTSRPTCWVTRSRVSWAARARPTSKCGSN